MIWQFPYYLVYCQRYRIWVDECPAKNGNATCMNKKCPLNKRNL